MTNFACILLTAALTAASSAVAAAAAPEPIRTTRADVGQGFEIRLGMESFQDVELEEVEAFDGWSAYAEASWAFAGRYKLRLAYPFKTDGDAYIKDNQPWDPGKKVDIEGNGGVYDFLVFTFEHQLSFAGEQGYNLSWYLGGGTKAGRLDTTKWDAKSKTFDPFNHTGNLIHGGVKYDREFGFGQLLTDLGLRYYWNSDDIYPGGNKDSWPALDLRAAVIFAPWKMIYPVIEATYLGDFSDMNQLALIPQLLLPVGDHLQLKAGVNIGLGGTGSEFGGLGQVVVHF